MAARNKVRPAPWSPTHTREEARAYLQARLILFSRLMFWIFWLLVVFVLALYELYPSARPARVAVVHYFAICGLLVGGLVWYVTLHRSKPSIERLYGIDAFYQMLIGTAFGISIYYSCDQRANVYSGLIWHIFAVFTRVIILPSTGRRTAVIASCSFAPLLIAAIAQAINFPERLEIPPVAFVAGSSLTAAVVVLLATTGSQVIYGLRRQITAAMQLGQYTLEDKIGEGGMGAVYRARHAMLRRPTAIKLLPIDKYGPESILRFEREVQHMARLTHPNTVAVFDYGRSPDGVFYYAMEYLDGIDLESLVRRDGPQPAPRVVHIMRQVCGALDEAHTMGLIHRDIKPANVILCQRGRIPDVVKVVDYGLVKELTRHGGPQTAPVVIAGTPAYLAPETVTDPHKVGAPSDLYSLAAVGYFLLTGTMVFEARTSMLMCLQHVTAEPPPPSQRGVAVPADLEALILACLAKDPAARPASARELRTALGKLDAAHDWDEEAALDWWRAFTESRAAGKGKGKGDRDEPASTITIDVLGRTAEGQVNETGQAT